MSPEPVPTTSASPRRDAVANRERLLDAAMAEIVDHGLKVPMSEIAAAAGVGVGTLYRHFPARDDLLRALTVRAFEQVLARARACEDRSPPDALRCFLHGAIRDRGRLILPLHGGPPELDPRARALQAEIRSVLAGVLRRGRAEGSIRADVTPRDIVITAASLANPLTALDDWDRWARRMARIYLAGLAPPPAA